MKKSGSKHIQLLVFILLSFIPYSYSQEGGAECKVLLKGISGSYKGDCKDGLANGKGTATGEDSYTGAFLNGLPEGKGVYKYKNGNMFSGYWKNGLKNGRGEFKSLVNGKATLIKGYWKDGDYAGISEPDEEYRITKLTAIENYTIKNVKGDQNFIEVSFEKVNKKYVPRDLEVTLSSGYKIEQNKKIIIQNYNFPVNCDLHFTIPITGGVRQCNLAFTIYKPGKIEVFISNN
ncbi:MAG: hypothetical protein Q7U54_15495 [Bacteroidales bacterium]|nr:hypothetical protein [Bacteroidales bacterium]